MGNCNHCCISHSQNPFLTYPSEKQDDIPKNQKKITVEVPNAASMSKDILFHISKFLEKMVFQLMFEIIK